ncbi:MAG: hypothetical protein V3R54_02345 [Thermodesulfovibrionia bacterium]
MSDTPSGKKPAPKAGNKEKHEKAIRSIVKAITPHISDSTREQLKKMGDKLSKTTDKGVHMTKDVTERIRHFTSGATKLTKLKIEIYKMKSSRDNLISAMGEKLFKLYKTKKLKNVQSAFKTDFKKLDESKTKISKKEKEVSKVSL